MKYEAIIRQFYAEPLALTIEKMVQIRSFLWSKAAGHDVDPTDVQAIAAARRPSNVSIVGRVAVVPVFGVISQRVSGMEESSGGVGAEAIGATLDSLVNDPSISSIVMSFDSPGGSVYGIPELGAKIAAAADRKKVVGLADSVAASAAYWLISQCREVNVTPGGQVGSIGVIAAHEDWSKSDEMKGVKTTLVTSSKFKAEGHPFGPLDDSARAEMQGKVDHYHAEFVGAVAKGRQTTAARVEKDFGQGRMMTAKAAVSAGMADHVATLETVLKRLGAYEGSQGQRAMARARAVQVDCDLTRESGAG